MAKDHGAPEAGQLSRAWTRGRRDRKLQKSEQRRVRNWTVHNKMRGVLSTSSSVKIEGTCVSKNLDETVRLQSEKREEWIREIRGDYKGLLKVRVALPVWPAHQPRRSSGETSARRPIVA